MDKRIVQMLVTVAVDTDRLAADAQEEIESRLAALWPSVIVEPVGSRVRSRAASPAATSETEEK